MRDARIEGEVSVVCHVEAEAELKEEVLSSLIPSKTETTQEAQMSFLNELRSSSSE